MTDPVLRADGARIAVDGATAIARLSLATRGQRVVLGGDVDALTGALIGVPTATTGDGVATPGGEARVEAGTLELCGRDVAAGRHVAIAGLAPRDPPLPPQWTVHQYLQWAGRLAGMSRRAARDSARGALQQLGWAAASTRSLRTLSTPERRVVVIAQALVGEPEVLVCDQPLGNLNERDAMPVAQALSRACAGRAALVSVTRLVPPGPESELVRTASDVCVLRAGSLLVHTEPHQLLSEGIVAEVSVQRQGAALRDELAAEGAVVHGGPMHFAVALPVGKSLTDVLAVAVRVGAPVVRCLPLVG